jgi:hypothetical protein
MSKKKAIPTYIAHIVASDDGYRTIVTRDGEQVHEGVVRRTRKAARMDAARFVVQCPEKQRNLQWDDPFLDEPAEDEDVGQEGEKPRTDLEWTPERVKEMAERYREWLRNFPKEPADRMAMALAAMKTFEACQHGATATKLRPLVAAASSSHKLVFETGCNLLVRLAERHPEAQRSISQMARDKNATARFHAVAYLHEDLPEELRREVVQIALDDRSIKVRQKAIEGADRFRFTDLLPRLEEMQRAETNEAVQRSLGFHVPLLRDGFLLEPSGDGEGYYLTVRGPRSVGGPFISKEEYSEEFLRQEVARLKKAESWWE